MHSKSGYKSLYNTDNLTHWSGDNLVNDKFTVRLKLRLLTETFVTCAVSIRGMLSYPMHSKSGYK